MNLGGTICFRVGTWAPAGGKQSTCPLPKIKKNADFRGVPRVFGLQSYKRPRNCWEVVFGACSMEGTRGT